MSIKNFDSRYSVSQEEALEMLKLYAKGETFTYAVEEVLPWLRGVRWAADGWFECLTLGYDPTPAMIEQRDTVDNMCYTLALDLSDENELEWDMSYIGDIRDAVIDYITSKTDKKESDIYP